MYLNMGRTNINRVNLMVSVWRRTGMMVSVDIHIAAVAADVVKNDRIASRMITESLNIPRL
jgi:hypothetical protein